MPQGVHARVLQRAAELLGGREKLRAHLGASRRDLEAWLAGDQEAPLDAFLRAVDVISARPMSPTQRRDAILSHPATATPPAPRSLLAFLQDTFPPERGKDMLEAALDAAISGTAARMGNIQLACPDGLRIAAQRGFDEPYLAFFGLVEGDALACGQAMKHGKRIVVDDAAADPTSSLRPACAPWSRRRSSRAPAGCSAC